RRRRAWCARSRRSSAPRCGQGRRRRCGRARARGALSFRAVGFQARDCGMAEPSTPDVDGIDPAPPRSAGGARGPLVSRRLLILGGVAGLWMLGSWIFWRRTGHFPPDTTPEGAYLRIAVNITGGKVRDCFAYLEDQAQHSAYSIRDYRRQASARVAAAYPEPER